MSTAHDAGTDRSPLLQQSAVVLFPQSGSATTATTTNQTAASSSSPDGDGVGWPPSSLSPSPPPSSSSPLSPPAHATTQQQHHHHQELSPEEGGEPPPPSSSSRRRSRSSNNRGESSSGHAGCCCTKNAGLLSGGSFGKIFRDATAPLEDKISRQEAVRKQLILVCLLILAIAAIGSMLLYLRFVLVPLVLAKFLQYVLDPIVKWLHVGSRPCSLCCRQGGTSCRCCGDSCRQFLLFGRLPHWIAVTVSLLVALMVIIAFGLLVSVSINQLMKKSDVYLDRAHEILNHTSTWLEAHGYDSDVAGIFGKLKAEVGFSALLMSFANNFYGFVSDTILLFLFLVYMLYGHVSLPLVSDVGDLHERVDTQIRQYIIVKVVISLTVGLITGGLLFWLEVDIPLIFGLLSFFLNFIPNVGPFIALLLPLPIVILDPTKGWSSVILVIALPGTIHMIIGNFVEPKVLGKAMELHPITVVVALVFWGVVWGITGAVLSVPITAALKLLFENVDYPLFNQVAKVMGDEVASARSSTAAAVGALDREWCLVPDESTADIFHTE
ncbi:AI-2E family transporter [Pelomyxa schiedti]|nr:AI-2E family transporter [Pelomyxa schiedti]